MTWICIVGVAVAGALLLCLHGLQATAQPMVPAVTDDLGERLAGLQCMEPFRQKIADRQAGLGRINAEFLETWRETGPPAQFRENLPIAMGGVSMCFVEKCGSSRFKMLFLRQMGYRPEELLGPGHFKVHHAPLRGVPDVMEEYVSELTSAPRLIIVRSPYTRVLSAFLNKLHCKSCGVKGTQAAANADAMAERLNARAGVPLSVRNTTAEEGFALLVRAMHNSSVSSPDGRLRVDPHFAPISNLCLLRSGFRYDYNLKLEAIDVWYADFLALAGLQSEAASGWHISSHLNVAEPGQPCFYHPVGLSCSEVSRLRTTCMRPLAAAPHARADQQKSASHADDLAARFYTPELAHMVTEIYARDLRDFNYAVWDGVSAYDPLAPAYRPQQAEQRH